MTAKMEYSTKAYNYPQCSAGLYSIYNCKIEQIVDIYQPRSDGYQGIEKMIPCEKDVISIAKYIKDDVRKEQYLVVLFKNNEWILESQGDRTIYFNNELIDSKRPIPKIILLCWDYFINDVDEKRSILEKIHMMSH